MPKHKLFKLGIGKGVDWCEGSMGDTDIPSNPEVPDVTIGFHKNPPAPAYEDEEETIARQERKQATQDPFIQDLARRLGVPLHFLLDYRERAIGQFGPRLDGLRVSLTLRINQLLNRYARASALLPRTVPATWSSFAKHSLSSFHSWYLVPDYAKDDDPNVVFMKWTGYPKDDEKGASARAWDNSEKSWIPVTRAQ